MPRQGFAESLKRLFSAHAKIDTEFFEELADRLVEADMGAKTAFEVVDALERACRSEGIADRGEIVNRLAASLAPWVREARFSPASGSVSVFLVLGVNGVGKTTSVAKMAKWYRERDNAPIILAAADTFRAAAIEQLQLHGKRTDTRVVAHQNGSDPGAVVFSACDAARAQGGALVIADTAGRLHNKENLVRELQKIDRIAATKADEGCYRKFLVVDATTGQNALRQAETFHSAVGVDAVILTKYDSTASGGIAVSMGKELGLPVAFLGTGEGLGDFSAFDAGRYLSDLLGARV